MNGLLFPTHLSQQQQQQYYFHSLTFLMPFLCYKTHFAISLEN